MHSFLDDLERCVIKKRLLQLAQEDVLSDPKSIFLFLTVEALSCNSLQVNRLLLRIKTKKPM